MKGLEDDFIVQLVSEQYKKSKIRTPIHHIHFTSILYQSCIKRPLQSSHTNDILGSTLWKLS
jgi:hypothetical protein